MKMGRGTVLLICRLRAGAENPIHGSDQGLWKVPVLPEYLIALLSRIIPALIPLGS